MAKLKMIKKDRMKETKAKTNEQISKRVILKSVNEQNAWYRFKGNFSDYTLENFPVLIDVPFLLLFYFIFVLKSPSQQQVVCTKQCNHHAIVENDMF